MIRSPHKLRLVIALLCVALVAMRIGGVHLHLCLDGGEPPIALHMSDAGLHHADEPGTAHADHEVALGADALVKKPFGGLELPMVGFTFALLLFVLTHARDPLPEFFTPLRLSPARAHLRPPLRGPPR